MKTYIFHSDATVRSVCDPLEPWDVRNEPMLFRADAKFARVHGGPITREFLDLLSLFEHGDDVLVDSRVHMLMPGWYPCIPGWHHDDVPRERSDGQPNYENPSYRARHYMMLVNADIAPTQFIRGVVTLPEVPLGQRIYQAWDGVLQTQDGLRTWSVPDRSIIEFNDHAFHRGVPAVRKGWRFFIRATAGSLLVPNNEVRSQVQVYLPVVNQGW